MKWLSGLKFTAGQKEPSILGTRDILLTNLSRLELTFFTACFWSRVCTSFSIALWWIIYFNTTVWFSVSFASRLLLSSLQNLQVVVIPGCWEWQKILLKDIPHCYCALFLGSFPTLCGDLFGDSWKALLVVWMGVNCGRDCSKGCCCLVLVIEVMWALHHGDS